MKPSKPIMLSVAVLDLALAALDLYALKNWQLTTEQQALGWTLIVVTVITAILLFGIAASSRIIRGLFAVALLFVISASVSAQNPNRIQPPRQSHVADISFDAALATSMIADEVSSYQVKQRCPTCRELGLPTSARIPLKIGVFTLVEIVKKKYPNRRLPVWITEAGLSALYFGITAHNSKIGR